MTLIKFLKKSAVMLIPLWLSACSTSSLAERSQTEGLGVQELLQQLAAQPARAQVSVGGDLPDGEQTIQASSGRTMKTVVRNGIIDEYADVYHPNGMLHSHTVIIDGVAQGWSTGYRPDGTLQSRIFYQDGKVTQVERYDAQGRLQDRAAL